MPRSSKAIRDDGTPPGRPKSAGFLPSDDQPPPIPGVIVAGLLRLIAAGLEAVEAQPARPGARVGVLTCSGWWLVIELDDTGAPAAVLHAQSPSPMVPAWTWGCQRDDWTLGHDSRVITPIELLTVEQREQLTQRLRAAPAPWTWGPLPYWDLSNLDEEELTLD